MSAMMQMLLGSGALNDAILVAQVTGTATTPTPTALGAAVGDLAIGCSYGTLFGAPGNNYTPLNTGGAPTGAFSYRFLVSGDMGSPIFVTGPGNLILYILRGVTSINAAVTDSGVASTPHFRTRPGFTRAINHAGIIGFSANVTSSTGTPATTPALITSPTAFTTNSLAPINSGQTQISALGYRLVPGAPPYVSGDTFTYGDGLSVGNARTQYLSIIELLR